MKKDYLFIRNLKKVDFTVFCVDSEQKKYYDKMFGEQQPYSSGQQTKHSIMENILDQLDLPHAPIIYNFQVNKDKLEQKEIAQPCDPSYHDQLIGGWMSMPSKKGDKKIVKKNIEISSDDEMENDLIENKDGFKRRSPFSISAMTPIHPLLVSLVNEAKMTFDRSESNDEKIAVRDSNGKPMDEKSIEAFLENCNSKLTKRKLVSKEHGEKRANGFFKHDIVIDLRKIFRVPIMLHDKEMSDETIIKLKKEGWTEYVDKFGTSLELPKKDQAELAEAIAWGLINWRIISNQSRTFDFMTTLSVAISTRADEIPNSIRGEIQEIDGRLKGNLVVDTNYPNTKIYSTKALNGYVLNAETSYTAIDDAVCHIKNAILEYYK